MQLSVREAARLLKVSETTVYRWIRQGAIPASQISDQVRLSKAELLEWASARKVPVSPEMFADDAGPAPVLLEAFQEGGVFQDVPGGDKTAVMKAVVAALPLSEEIDREFLLQILLARESLGSTAIGDGIAIPHVRNPIVLQMDRPMIALCFLKEAIDFGAADGRPVDKLFMLFTPTVRLHLQLLSQIVFLLRNADFWAALARKAPREELMAIVGRVATSIPKAGQP